VQDPHKGSGWDLVRSISAAVSGNFPYTRAHKRPLSGAIEVRKSYAWAVRGGSRNAGGAVLRGRGAPAARRSVRYRVGDNRSV
jgi:hypothetical protein